MNSERNEGLKVVLDTNVYISAFTHPEGHVFPIWSGALQRRYTLLVSPAIAHEVAGVLQEKFGWEQAQVIRRLKLLVRVAEIVTPSITLDVIREDLPDNRILECAMEGKADLIVSGDRHLQRLKTYQGIPIMRPVDFVRTLGGLQ